MSTYKEQLKDPQWQKKRLEIMQRDKWTCCACGSKDNHLNVHHRHYLRAAMPWMYADAVYVTLCEDCHERWHETQDIINAMLCRIPADMFIGLTSPEDRDQYAECFARAIAAIHRSEIEDAERAGFERGFDSGSKHYADVGESQNQESHKPSRGEK